MSWAKRHARAITAVVWITALASGLAWGLTHGLSIGQILGAIYTYVNANPYAMVVFVLFFGLVRPVIFLPAMWLNIAAGSLFGFWIGALCALIGENMSASTAYTIARFYRRKPKDEQALAEVSKFQRLLHEQTFPTVLAMRASYLPFDPVNYGCGLMRVPWRPYFLGTLMGALPPMLTFVSFGASINFEAFVTHLEEFDSHELLDGTQLLISLLLLAVSAGTAWVAYRHRKSV